MLGGSFLNTTVYDVVLPDGEIVDRQPPQAPRYSFNGLARKTWEVAGLALTAQADFRYLAPFYSSVSNAPDTYVPGAGIAGALVGVGSLDGTWDFSVRVNNMFNRDVLQLAYDLSGFGVTEQVYAPPRWISGEFTYRWK